MRLWLIAGACSIVSFQACTRPDTTPDLRDLPLQPAARYLVEAFDEFPLVAFSEPRHGASGTKEFFASLIRQPRFAGRINDIVVEFGNSRYQDVVDRYVAGEPVPRDRLKAAWENTTIVTGIWTAPVYEAVLTDIRALNTTLPPHQRIRVLLGDPPIDWSVVRGPADEDMNDWRDAHFAWVVEEQVMKRKRRALLWIGGAHISRQVRFPGSLIHLLDQRFPNRTLVAIAIDPQDAEPHVRSRLEPWPESAAVRVRGTWLGRLDFSAVGARFSTATIQENLDVAVFWASPPGVSDDTPRIDAGSPFAAELQRRRHLSEATLPFRGGRIRFAAGTAAFTAESEPALGAVLAELRRDSGLGLLVKAFADAREAEGIQLSWDRAHAVVSWLTERGVSPARLTAKGCGSSRALWIGGSEDERAANRRAELVRISKWVDCEPPTSFDIGEKT